MSIVTSEYFDGNFTQTEQNYLDGIQDATKKNIMTSALIASYDSNGRVKQELPGVAKSYIRKSEFFQLVEIKDFPTGLARIYELALNWAALGKGKGGLAGAGVRYALRDRIDPTRETTFHTDIPDSAQELIKDYLEFYENNKDIQSLWAGNAWNVLGIATSCFIKESHHWDSQNTRPQKALIGSLNQLDSITDNEMRKLFYLAIHPMPLTLMNHVVNMSKDPANAEISEIVRMRLRVAPAGLAAICITGSTVPSLQVEEIAKKFPKDLVEKLDKLQSVTNDIMSDPVAFHPFASRMGVNRNLVDTSAHKRAMAISAAFIKSQLRGTLGKSPALNKWIGTEQRMVSRLQDAMDAYYENQNEDIVYIISGEHSRDWKEERLNEKLQTMKRIGKIEETSAIDLSEVKKATTAAIQTLL
jgi:hypothetical protein